jgi:PucR family transcriptional regulator, purine catabolism regulatory protein
VAVTLREILELHVFRDAEIVANADQVDREVRWVHIGEVPDIHHFIKGGELLLTSGLNLDMPPTRQREYVDNLVKAGAAAVAVQLGRVFDDLPAPLVERAASAGLPLIVFRRKTRFLEVTEEVHAAIVNRHYRLLQQAEQVGRDLAELAVAGAKPWEIVQRLATVIESPVVLENAAHEVVSSSRPDGLLDRILDEWAAHSRIGHTTSHGVGVNTQKFADHDCVWTEIIVRRETWGRLHLIAGSGRRADELTRLAVDRAGSAIALSLHVQRDWDYLSDTARDALVTDVVEGRCWSVTELNRRAQALGANFAERELAAVVLELDNLSAVAAERDLSEAQRQSLRGSALRITRDCLRKAHITNLSTVHGDRILALVGVPTDSDFKTATTDALAAVIDSCRRELGGIKAFAGVSGRSADGGLNMIFVEADEAIAAATPSDDGRTVFHFGEIGLNGLLMRLADGPVLARFVEGELKPLLDNDARSAHQLTPTLRAYLDANGNKAKAATTLSIGRRSLYHRLTRIGRFLQRDVDDPDVRIRLALALRGLDVLRGRSAGRLLDRAGKKSPSTASGWTRR